MQTIELQIKISEMKMSHDELNSRLEMVEEMAKLEDRTIEIIWSKLQQKYRTIITQNHQKLSWMEVWQLQN